MADTITPAAPVQGTPATAAPATPAASAPAVPAAPATPAAPAPTAVATPATGTVLTDPTPPAATAAAEWTPKIPEGVTLDKSYLDGFTAWAKDSKVDGAAAQKLLDVEIKSRQAAETTRLATVTQWAEESRADKDIGGAAFDANITAAKKALDRFGTPGFKEMLTKTGLGNHKDTIRIFAQIGKLISEDRMPNGTSSTQVAESREDGLRAAFPASPEMFQGR